MKFGTPQLGDLDVPVRAVQLVDGEVLVREGDQADDVYVISSGELVATTRSDYGDVTVGRIGAGQVVGEVTVIAGGRRMATLTADGPAEVKVIRRADFEQRLPDRDRPLRDLRRRSARPDPDLCPRFVSQAGVAPDEAHH